MVRSLKVTSRTRSMEFKTILETFTSSRFTEKVKLKYLILT